MTRDEIRSSRHSTFLFAIILTVGLNSIMFITLAVIYLAIRSPR